MDKKILQAYKFLVPKDQLIIDAMIIALYEKDEKIIEVLRSVEDSLAKEEG